MKYDVIVLGGGAAGLFCAAQAGQRGCSVLMIEHNNHVGRKIEISGGGRCNFTNIHANPENYISHNPRFCLSALKRYTPQDFIALVEDYGIRYHEKKLGQMFCDDRSDQIVDMLVSECRKAQVTIQVNTRVETVEKHDSFRVITEKGVLESQTVVVATGGLSLPKLGASGMGYQIAKQFGLKRIEYKPGLVPLTMANEDIQIWGKLRGLSLPVQIQCGEQQFEENILFTHRGVSGPAVLQISNYWQHGEDITINLLPHFNIHDLCTRSENRNMQFSTLLSYPMPNRFAQLFTDTYFKNKPVKQYSHQEIDRIDQIVHHWKIKPAGTEGYRKAEVTLGGVDTQELSPKTMEAKKVPGLFFIGEVVDVTGGLGGYNFQWAWSSGFAAGTAI